MLFMRRFLSRRCVLDDTFQERRLRSTTAKPIGAVATVLGSSPPLHQWRNGYQTPPRLLLQSAAPSKVGASSFNKHWTRYRTIGLSTPDGCPLN